MGEPGKQIVFILPIQFSTKIYWLQHYLQECSRHCGSYGNKMKSIHKLNFIEKPSFSMLEISPKKVQCQIQISYGFHKPNEWTFWARQAPRIWFMLMPAPSVLQAWTRDARDTPRILALEAAVTSPRSCPLLWLVKRNQVRLPERFGPLQPATAGLAKPSLWRNRRNSHSVAESTYYRFS